MAFAPTHTHKASVTVKTFIAQSQIRYNIPEAPTFYEILDLILLFNSIQNTLLRFFF